MGFDANFLKRTLLNDWSGWQVVTFDKQPKKHIKKEGQKLTTNRNLKDFVTQSQRAQPVAFQ